VQYHTGWLVKIGVVVPIGHLNKHGYQYTWRECLRSHVAFGHKVYLVQSTRNQTGRTEILDTYPGLEFISDADTWFELHDDGEFFNIPQIAENLNRGARAAVDDGMDCLVHVDINSYIPEPGVLRGRCEEMLVNGGPYIWMYRMDQLADTMFHASTRLANIINLAFSVEFMADATWIEKCGIIGRKSGDFKEYDSGAIVDVTMEMPLSDMESRQNYIRCYHDRGGMAPSPVFNEGFFWSYTVRRMKTEKKLVGRPMSVTGLLIAHNNEPDFISNEVLRRI